MQRRIRHKEQKGKKGALLAELKSGQFICSKSGQFYLLTTAGQKPVMYYFLCQKQERGISMVTTTIKRRIPHDSESHN